MAVNLGPVFQSVGDFGSSLGRARLAATQYKLQQLFDQLGLKQGETNLEESQERLKRLKKQPATESEEMQQRFAAIEQIIKRPLTDQEKQHLLGLPEFSATDVGAQIEEGMKGWPEEQRKLVAPAVQGYLKLGQPEKAWQVYTQVAERMAERKPETPKQTKTYDPSGNLRYAWTDPNTGEVTAWGQLVPESDQFERWTDENDQIHVLRMPKSRKVDPGTIRMTDKAEKQWESITEAAPRPGKVPAGVGTKGGAGKPVGGGGTVIGTTTPKYSTTLNASLKEAKGSYDEWIKASKNAEYHTPRTDLAIVFSAVRSAVQGAGRMTNVELDRELKAGSFGDRLRRQWDMATKGTLPDDQREDLLRTIRNAWMAKAQSARGLWKDEKPDKSMPLFIQGEDISPGGNAPTGGTPPPGAKIIPLDQFLKEKPPG